MTQNSPLLSLPGEIRNHIVEYAFTRELGTAPPPLSRSQLALPSACRQLYSEFQALALSSTIFSIRWTSAHELGAKASRLPLASRSSIRKLQLLLPPELEALFVGGGGRKRVKNFNFADAGLTELQELYLRYPPNNDARRYGVTSREFLMLASWKILWERGNDSLTKVCAVHDGAQPYLCLTLLHGMMKEFGPLRRSSRWKMRPNFEYGQIDFLEKRHDGEPSRQVTVVVGYSFQEAENYVAVREQLLEGKHAEVVAARRAECVHVKPIRETSDDLLRGELLNLALLFRITHGPVLDVADKIIAIRSTSDSFEL